ncbi:hypothetical protein [Pinisolibacter sp.]|uniref:hypothetical protein n=1 Tax=Pinisolibacter sp. TaxID=2172024 RepID=UPI002FDE5A49
MKRRPGWRPVGWQNCDEARELAMALDGGFEPDSYEEPEDGGIDWGPGIQAEAVRSVAEAGIDEAITRHIEELRSKWLDDLKDRLTRDREHGFSSPLGHAEWCARLAKSLGYTSESVRVMISARCKGDAEFRDLWRGVAKPAGRPRKQK